MQRSRLGSWQGHRWMRVASKQLYCYRERPVRRGTRQSFSNRRLSNQASPLVQEEPGQYNVSTNPLDRALAERNLDASWNLMLELLTSRQKIDDPYSPDPSSSIHEMDEKPKIFLNECLKMRRSDLVFAFFRRFPSNRYLFGTALKKCLRLGQYQYICDLIDLQASPENTPDAYIYNAHIIALSRLGRLKEARSVFDTAVEAGEDSIYVYNTMIDAYARTGNVGKAEEIWEKLKRSGMKADAISYVAILRAWGNRGNFDRFRELYTELQSKELKPMPHTFTILFDCITKKTASVDVEWLIEMISSMKQHELPMNQHILSAMISAFSLQKLDAEHLQFVFSTVSEFRQETCPGNKVYCALIKFCCRQKIPQRAKDVWKMIKSDGVEPNGYVYSAIINACGAMTLKQRGWRFVSQIVYELKGSWLAMRDKTSAEDTMRWAFNSLLHFYAETRNAGEALGTYASMQQHGPSPDRITYNSVLASLSTADDAPKIQNVLKDMQMADCSMDSTTYSILLSHCADRRDVAGSMTLLEEMREKGLAPTVECYTSAIDTCVKDGSEPNLNLAFDLFQRLKREKIRPTVVTYGCLFEAFRATENVDGAFALYREACLYSVSPSDQCHNVLIGMCTEVGRLDDALDLIKVLVRKHGDIAEETMNSMTRALAVEYLPRSLVLLRMMKHRSMAPSAETLNCLILACCRESDSQHAFVLYKEMTARRHFVRVEAASALIKSLSKAGEVLAAIRVTNNMFERAGLPSIDPSHINREWHPTVSRRKERIAYSALPKVTSLGFLIVGLVQKSQLQTAMYVFRQISILNNASGIMLLAKDVCQVFELLIESSCTLQRVDWAIEVFLQWSIAAEKMIRTIPAQKRNSRSHFFSLF